jgi:predicted small secreted protein
MRRLLLLATLLAAFAFAAACNDSDGDGSDDGAGSTPIDASALTPVRGNSEVVVGPNRFSLGLLDPDGDAFIPDENTSLRLRFSYLNDLIFELETTFVFAIPGETGFFVANVNFPSGGEWSVEPVMTTATQTTTLSKLAFTVLEQSEVPNIGDRAIAVENLTLSSEPNMKRVSTDENPNPAFYQKTVAQALQEARPMVIVFATPAFCQTSFCGPILDNVKAIQPEFADTVDFIHIEPFELDADGNLVTDASSVPVVTAPMQAWKLQTEPWVYVVDAQGLITARFEGAAAPEELRAAIQAATAP